MSVYIPPTHREGQPGRAEPQGQRTVPMPRLIGHGCFGCGTANAQGLGMTFSRRADRVLAHVTLHRPHMGWDRIAHGGVVSTVLDEAMAWAVIALERTFFVTRSMTVTYKKPVPLEVPLVAEGWIVHRDPPRGCRTGAWLMDDQERLLAEAQGEMAYLPPDRLHVVSAPLREEMQQLFAAMAALDSELER